MVAVANPTNACLELARVLAISPSLVVNLQYAVEMRCNVWIEECIGLPGNTAQGVIQVEFVRIGHFSAELAGHPKGDIGFPHSGWA